MLIKNFLYLFLNLVHIKLMNIHKIHSINIIFIILIVAHKWFLSS